MLKLIYSLVCFIVIWITVRIRDWRIRRGTYPHGHNTPDDDETETKTDDEEVDFILAAARTPPSRRTWSQRAALFEPLRRGKVSAPGTASLTRRG